MQETPKYINLNGKPHGEPLWKTFHRSAGFRAGMLCSAFTVAVDAVANGTEYLFAMSMVSLLVPTIAAAKSQLMECYELDTRFKTNLLRFPEFKPSKKLVIDTSPENIINDDDIIRKARRSRNTAMGALGIYGAAAIGIVGYVGAKAGVSSIYEAGIVLGLVGQFTAPIVETWLSHASRFNKVVKGEYAIVDTPPQRQEPRPSSLSFEPT